MSGALEEWGVVANLRDADRKGIRAGEKLWVARLDVGSGCERNLMRSNRTGLEKWIRTGRLTGFRPAFVPPTMTEALLERHATKAEAAHRASMLNIVASGDEVAIRRYHLAAWRDAGSPGHPG